MASVGGPLTRWQIGSYPETKLAIHPVTVQRVTEDGVVSGDPLDRPALIDTGATGSAVSPGLRALLDLEASDFTEQGLGGQPGEQDENSRPLYWLRITIGTKGWDVLVFERATGADVLIGCDILQHYRFTYDGLDGPDGSYDLYLPD